MDRKPNGQFAKGAHWRPRKPYWSREWMVAEYVVKERSASEIAEQFGITDNAVYHWLHKLGIPRRTVSEARSVKRWGSVGVNNPMYGKRGADAPGYKHGNTPERQTTYSRSEWRTVCKLVWERDAGVCAHCGVRNQRRRMMHVHHIKPFDLYPELRCDANNLILLCAKCHYAEHKRMRMGVMPKCQGIS